MRSRFCAVALVGSLVAAATIPAASAVAQSESPESRLQKLGIDPSRAGIEQYLESLIEDDIGEKTDALIAQLSDQEFKVREKAAQQLTSLGFPPIDKLEAEVGHPLFTRSKSGWTLTPAGTLLLAEARSRIAAEPARAAKPVVAAGGKAKASKGKGRAPAVKGQPKPYKKRQGR